MIHLISLLALACDPISGSFEATDVPCVESPLLLCIDGAFTGDLEADYIGAFTSLVPAPTLAQPLRLAYTSDDTFTTDTETITGESSGYIVLNDTLAATVCVIGCLADAECLGGCLAAYGGTVFENTTTFDNGRGGLDASGTGGLDGVSRGTYTGELCEAP